MRHSRAIRNTILASAILLALAIGWDVAMGAVAIRHVLRAQRDLVLLEDAWKQKEWRELHARLGSAAAALARSQAALRRTMLVSRVPLLGTEVRSTEHLTGAGAALMNGARQIADIARTSIEPILGSSLDTSQLSVEDRVRLHAALAAAIPDIDVAARSFAVANTLVRRISPEARILAIEPVGKAYVTVRAAAGFFSDIEPLVTLLPRIAGFEREQTYLVLFQNNTELRPTGGFIGTYGILRVRDGRILSFVIDDTYNLDRAVPAKSRPAAPQPLRDYLGQPYWYLRDANWSPDFPETARRALQFYREEGGTAAPNAVIAVTTDLLVDLMQLTGPIHVGNSQFTADTVVDTLQSAVEVDYYRQGIPENERKAIVGALGGALAERLQRLSPYELRDLVAIVRTNLDEKNILLYDTDAPTERQYRARNWAGEVKQGTGDYLMVVDANLGSLKTDPAVDRTIDYRITRRSDGRYVATVAVAYDHEGHFTWKTTRLRNYVRIYVPRDSRLLSWSGFMTGEKKTAGANLLESQELGKAVFSGFIAVEPGETKSIQVSYLLPDAVVSASDGLEHYSLYVQKQPGAAHHALTVVGPARETTAWPPQSLAASRALDGSVTWQTTLGSDQEFALTWKKTR